MILKLRTGDNGKRWVLFDGFRRLSHQILTNAEADEINADVITGKSQERKPEEELLVITGMYPNDTHLTFFVHDDAYLMNDEGKTIEKLW